MLYVLLRYKFSVRSFAHKSLYVGILISHLTGMSLPSMIMSAPRPGSLPADHLSLLCVDELPQVGCWLLLLRLPPSLVKPLGLIRVSPETHVVRVRTEPLVRLEEGKIVGFVLISPVVTWSYTWVAT